MIIAMEGDGPKPIEPIQDVKKHLMDTIAMAQHTIENFSLKGYFEGIAKSKGIPIDRVVAGYLNDNFYVYDYDSGRGIMNAWKVISVNGEEVPNV